MPSVVDDYERLIGQDQVRNARALLSAVERAVWLGEGKTDSGTSSEWESRSASAGW